MGKEWYKSTQVTHLRDAAGVDTYTEIIEKGCDSNASNVALS